MVQGVEKLGPKLRTLRFPDGKILDQRGVEIIRIRSDQDATAGISKDKLSRTINFRIHECSGVEPLIYAALSPGQVAVHQNLIRAFRPCAPSIRPVGTRWGEIEATPKRVDASEVPATHNLVNGPVGAAQEPLPPSKGKHIVKAIDPAERLIEIA